MLALPGCSTDDRSEVGDLVSVTVRSDNRATYPGKDSGLAGGDKRPNAFDSLFSAAPEAVCLAVSDRLAELRANPAMQRLLDSEDPSLDLFARLDDGASLRERTARALEAGLPFGPEHVLLCGPDGAWHGFDLRLNPISPGTGWLFLSPTAPIGATTDPAGLDRLSGLIGRDSLLGLLADRLSPPDDAGALLLFGVDDLPQINRALGRGAGDHLMRNLARRLDAQQGRASVAARVGGDVFGVVLGDIAAPRRARLCALDIAAALTPPVLLDAERLTSAISVGIALFPNDGRDPETLLARAEAALADARQDGGGRVSFGAGGTAARARIVSALRRADLRGELDLHYQPIVSLKTGRPMLCEALLRWDQQGSDSIGVADFTRLTEQSAAMDTLRRFSVEEALRQHRAWGRDDLRICVNVSPEQIATDAALDWLLDRLDRPGARDALVIEITETARFHDPAQFARLHRLRAAGIALAIDDFGTGFSTLDYLARIPADFLKIDGSFTRGLDAAPYRKLMRAAIALGHDFGMTVIAENVETEEQAAFLRREGCDMAQGYAFGGPRPASDWGPHGP
jgi:diguanylate cyclase (GGDEF)-like protein